jgi:hypothetical protein
MSPDVYAVARFDVVLTFLLMLRILLCSKRKTEV